MESSAPHLHNQASTLQEAQQEHRPCRHEGAQLLGAHCSCPLGQEEAAQPTQPLQDTAALALLLPKGLSVHSESHSVTFASETANKAWGEEMRQQEVLTTGLPASC